MNPVLSSMKGMLQTNDFLIQKAFDGVSNEHIAQRPNEKTNSLIFILGHLTNYRCQTCKLLGENMTFPHGDLFNRGTSYDNSVEFPEFPKLLEEWKNVSTRLINAIDNAGDDILLKEIPQKYPFGDQNILGALTFMVYHETYHIGQTALIRKYHGYDQLVG